MATAKSSLSTKKVDTKGGVRFEIDSRVAFTISLDGSEVLSLRKCDCQATKSA